MENVIHKFHHRIIALTMDGALSVHAAMSLEGSERYFMSLAINDSAGPPPKTVVIHNYIKDQQTLN